MFASYIKYHNMLSLSASDVNTIELEMPLWKKYLKIYIFDQSIFDHIILFEKRCLNYLALL